MSLPSHVMLMSRFWGILWPFEHVKGHECHRQAVCSRQQGHRASQLRTGTWVTGMLTTASVDRIPTHHTGRSTGTLTNVNVTKSILYQQMESSFPEIRKRNCYRLLQTLGDLCRVSVTPPHKENRQNGIVMI